MRGCGRRAGGSVAAGLLLFVALGGWVAVAVLLGAIGVVALVSDGRPRL